MGSYCHAGFLLHADSLQLLERQVVGGEQAKNKDLKEKHRRRKRYADERKKQLVAALQNLDEDSGDWVLLKVYDSIQEEVWAKNKMLEKMQMKVGPGFGAQIQLTLLAMPGSLPAVLHCPPFTPVMW